MSSLVPKSVRVLAPLSIAWAIVRLVFAATMGSMAVGSLAGCSKNGDAVAASDKKTQAQEAATQRVASADAQGKRDGKPGAGNQALPLVLTAPVTEGVFASEVEALGTAKANEAIDVTAKISNRVATIRFKEGQFVKQGDVLVELDASEVRADLAVAEAALGDSRSQVNRSRELFQNKILSAQQMEQLEATLHGNEARVAAARSRLNDTFIRAPFNGRVGLRNVSVGSLVNPGAVITTLDDTNVMKVDFSVPETYLSMLSEGLEVAAKSAAYPGQAFRGRVIGIGSRVDSTTRSVVVRAQVPNRDGKLKPGMFMTVNLVRNDAKALILPEQALVPERDKQFVFLVRDGKARKTEVALGRRRPGEVEILQGIAAGDVVITEGTQKVRDGIAVRVGSAAE